MTEVAAFTLHLDGKPQGQPRPRFGAGAVYAGRQQRLAEGEIRRAWKEAGSPRLADGPLRLDLWLDVARPAGHFRKNGALSAEGERCPWPHRQKPDGDNAQKLVCDALNTLAWRDDVRFVEMHCYRSWAQWPSTTIIVRLLTLNEDERPEDRSSDGLTAKPNHQPLGVSHAT